jgi:hypothetical protein
MPIPAAHHRWLLLACAAALWPLPQAAAGVPWAWLACWTLPSALLAASQRRLPSLWARAALAVASQGLALALTVGLGPPLTRPAVLSCTILPPMVFAAVRAEAQDQALALFLAFCTVLVGHILGAPHWPALLTFGIAACGCLAGTARHQAMAEAGQVLAATRRQPVLTASLGALALLLAGLLGAVLAALPSPMRWSFGAGERASQATAGPPRATGLGDDFVLGGGGGLAGMRHDRLVRVRTADGRAVPSGLYLRSGFFAAPGLDAWQTGPLEAEPAQDDPVLLREPLPGLPVHWLEIERFAGARDLVPVPPGTCTLRHLPGLQVDERAEWLRQTGRTAATSYEVGYQELVAGGALVAPSARKVRGLLELPATLDRERWARLLHSFGAAGEPGAILTAVGNGLDTLCRYDRRDPTGPYRHSLDNFVFAPRERRGYCMHFAAAAALLLRLAGVPCRIGVGLYHGQADAADGTSRVFGSQHAHAWVEVPWQGRGFVVFDPTPAAHRGQVEPSGDAAANLEDAAPEVPATDWWAIVRGIGAQPWLLALVLLSLFVGWLRPTHGRPSTGTPPPSTAMQQARRHLGRILRELAQRDQARRRGSTLEQFAAELAAQQHLPAELAAAFAAYQEVRFGGRPFDTQREQVMAKGLAAVLALPLPTPAPAPAAPGPAPGLG